MVEPAHLSTFAELLAASGESPFIRYAVGERGVADARAVPGGVAVPRTTHTGRRSWTLLGGPDAVAVLLDQVPFDAGAARRPFSVTLPRACLPVLSTGFRVCSGDDWDWMWTFTPPPPATSPEARDVIPLGSDGDSADIAAFLDTHSPRASVQPGGHHEWFGIREPHGALVAVAALATNTAGSGQLHSIAVDRSRRGEGLGGQITGAVTRTAVHRYGACTLGLYADNAPARALYRSVGYYGPLEWSSRDVIRR